MTGLPLSYTRDGIKLDVSSIITGLKEQYKKGYLLFVLHQNWVHGYLRINNNERHELIHGSYLYTPVLTDTEVSYHSSDLSAFLSTFNKIPKDVLIVFPMANFIRNILSDINFKYMRDHAGISITYQLGPLVTTTIPAKYPADLRPLFEDD